MLRPLFDVLEGATANATPPWQQASTEASEAAAKRVLSQEDFIDFNDPRVLNSGVSDNQQLSNMFAAYVGLTRLNEIVDFTLNDRNGSSLSLLLDRRFQEGLSEIKSFVNDLSFENETLLYGIKQSTISSTAIFPALNEIGGNDYVGAVTSEARDDAIPNLTGTETFTITVESDDLGTIVVNADLSQVSGDLTEDNIVDYMNDEMLSAGVSTWFETASFSEFSYGLRVNGSTGETVTFSDPSDSEVSVYLAGHTSAGSFSRAFMTEFDNMDEDTPGSIFRDVLDGEGVERANASAVDSDGNLYVVGTTEDDIGSNRLQGDSDVYLRKFDSAGQEVWSRLLGSQESTNGLAVTVDADNNVIIAGQTADNLSATAVDGGLDSFVTKFDAEGVEQWTYQVPRTSNDGARSVTTDAAGNIFFAGYTTAAISSDITHGGGTDGYVTKLTADGSFEYSKQFDSAGEDKAIDIQVDGSGNFYVLGETDGEAILRKFTDDDSSQTPTWELNLGDLGTDGAATSLAVGSNGAVYVSGYSDASGLSGTVAQSHSGDTDGFIQKIDDAGTSASIDYVSYLGTSGADQINDIAIDSSGASDRIFVAGTTDGNLAGGDTPENSAAFLAELDDTGSLVESRQVGTTLAHQGATVAIDSDGKNVLTRLGLPTGTIVSEPTNVVTAQTSLRAGSYFEISVNGELSERITIEADDSLGFLAYKINAMLGTAGRASVEGTDEERYLKLEAYDGQIIRLEAGGESSDALVGLGLHEVTLAGDPIGIEDQANSPIFSLGIVDGLNLLTPDKAGDASVILENALKEIRDMFKFMATGGEEPEPLPPLTQAQSEHIGELQGALLAMQIAAENAQVGAKALFDMQA